MSRYFAKYKKVRSPDRFRRLLKENTPQRILGTPYIDFKNTRENRLTVTMDDIKVYLAEWSIEFIPLMKWSLFWHVSTTHNLVDFRSLKIFYLCLFFEIYFRLWPLPFPLKYQNSHRGLKNGNQKTVKKQGLTGT